MLTLVSIGIGMRALKIITLSFVLLAALAWTAMTFLVPLVVERKAREGLERAGFAHASFSVGTIALDRVELLDVSLQKGLALGDVVIEAGPYQLWRGQRASVVVRGAEVDVTTRLSRSSPSTTLPFERVVIEDSHLVSAGERISVHGSIDLRGREPSFDLVAEAPVLHFGSTELSDVAATVRGPTSAARLCATARAQTIQLDGCIQLDQQRGALEWAARDDRFTATGRGTLRLAGDSLVLEDGRIDATLAAGAVRGVQLAPTTLHADVTADFASQTFTVRGELSASSLEARNVVLHDLTLPVSLDGTLDHGVALRSVTPLVLSVARAEVTAMGRSVTIERPVLRGAGLFELAGLRVSAQSDDTPFEITTTLRAVSLPRVIAMVTKERVRATGLLDGELVFGVDANGLSLVDATLTARTGGTLHATDFADITVSGAAVHRRVAAALADFRYSLLTLAVDDRSTLRLSLAGRGARVPQELSVDINVRGLLAQRN